MLIGHEHRVAPQAFLSGRSQTIETELARAMDEFMALLGRDPGIYRATQSSMAAPVISGSPSLAFGSPEDDSEWRIAVVSR